MTEEHALDSFETQNHCTNPSLPPSLLPCQWWDPSSPSNPEVKGRAVAEEYALDSFENLLYSICRFKVRGGREGGRERGRE